MIKVGDRVQFTKNFLRSTGMFAGPVPFAKGPVTKIENDIATIVWDDDEGVPSKVKTSNLEVIR